MLLIGVTGGIGSGKSTFATMLADHGAVRIDADQLARDAVAPGTVGLAEVVAHFGPGVIRDGALDRSALAAIVFSDPSALEILERITHPQVRRLFEIKIAALPPDSIVVHEVPLLAEKSLEAQYHLVIGVACSESIRVDRLLLRGLDRDEIDRRMRNQFGDAERNRHCDVVIDNGGDVTDLAASVESAWLRISTFAGNINAARPARRDQSLTLVDHDASWPEQAQRLIRRLHRHLGTLPIAHVGSTAVPGLIAKDVIDLQVSVADLADVEDEAFLAAGFAPHPSIDRDAPRPSEPDPEQWRKRLFGSCDPGRPVNIHVRPIGSVGERYALLFTAWMRGDAQARADYAKLKSTLSASLTTTSDYAQAKEPWFHEQEARMLRWAAETGWLPGRA